MQQKLLSSNNIANIAVRAGLVDASTVAVVLEVKFESMSQFGVAAAGLVRVEFPCSLQLAVRRIDRK